MITIQRLFRISWPAVAALMAIEAAAAPTPAAVTLQVPFTTTVQSVVGPSAVVARQDLRGFASDAERRYVHVGDSNPGLYTGAAAVVMGWVATGVLDNAQGTLSFWVRTSPRLPQFSQSPPRPRLRLVGTQGGEWVFGLSESPYYKLPWVKDVATSAEIDKLDERVAGGAEAPKADLSAKDEEGGTAPLDLDGTNGPPAAVLDLALDLKPFSDSGPASQLACHVPLVESQAWHHVVWTWRAGWHGLWVDGQLRASATPIQTLSRLEPMRGDQARLELLGEQADWADLRIYRRYFEDGVVSQLVKQAVFEYPADPAPLRAWAEWGRFTGRTVVYADAAGLKEATQVRWTCRNTETKEAVRTEVMTSLPSRFGEQVIKVFEPRAFPAGTYRYEAMALDAAGRELARAETVPWTASKTDEPWLGFDGGCWTNRKIKILPPFTPITVKEQTIGTVLRDHGLDRSGLFKSIRATGEELLAAPMALDVRVDGKALEFSGGPGLGGTSNQEDTVTWRSETVSAEGHRLEVGGYMEYDGMARFDMVLVPSKPLTVGGIELRIPYKPELLRLANVGLTFGFMAIERNQAGVYSCEPIHWCWVKPDPRRRPGVLFDSRDACTAPALSNQYPGRSWFAPYLQIGNNHRGLSWFAENDRGWIHNPDGPPPWELVARGDETFLRLNLVARSAELSEPLRLRFYLMANPVKPLPEGWRTWMPGDNGQLQNAVAERTSHRFWWLWGDYAGGFRPYPGVNEPGKPSPKRRPNDTSVVARTYEEWMGRFTDSLKGARPFQACPFINYGVPGGFPGYDDQAMATPYTWKLHNNRAVQDYMTYWLDRSRREVGIRGVYIDEPYSQPWSYNVLASDAPYIRPDGTRCVGFQYMDGREYIRRLKQMFADNGVDYSVWLHTTAYRVMPVYSFADISMDGEHPSIWVEGFNDYHSFYNPRYSRGFIAGHSMGLVGAQMFHANAKLIGPKADHAAAEHWKTRTYLAVTFPFGVLPLHCTLQQEFNRVQNINGALSVFDPGLDELSTDEQASWLPGVTWTPAPMAVHAVRNMPRQQALLYVAGPADGEGYASGRPSVRLAGGLDSLALGGKHNHAWNAENGVSLLQTDGAALDIAPHDFAIVLVQGRDGPQAARPPGAILGVSFDKGFEPDFGGGLVPVAAAGLTAASLVEGRDGKALRIRPGEGGVSYPVVPSWAAGTVEFDVRWQGLEGTLPLVRLDHNLDLLLALTRRGGTNGLLLRTKEVPLGQTPILLSAAATNKGESVEEFFPVPEDGGAWHRVALAWRSGHYELYADGGSLGRLQVQALPRLRDETVFAAGVRVGGGEAGMQARGSAELDNLVVYDWAFGVEDAAGKKRDALQAAPPPAGQKDFLVSVQVKDAANLSMAVNFRNIDRFWRIDKVRVTVTDTAHPKTPLATESIMPWMGQGVAWRWLFLGKASLSPPVARLDAESDDPAADWDEKEWTVTVDLMRDEPGPDNKPRSVVELSKTVTVKADALSYLLK